MKILELLSEKWVDGEWEDEDAFNDSHQPHKDNPEEYKQFIKPGRKVKLGPDYHKQMKGKKLGKGQQAKVHAGGQGMVRKSVRFTHPSDGHVQFILAAKKNQDNPFFPRIYNIRTHKTNEDDLNIMDVEMERLHELDNEMLRDAASMLFKNVGSRADDKYIERQYRGYDTEPSGIKSRTDLPDNHERLRADSHYFSELLGMSEEELRKRVKNDKFLEALKIVKQLVTDNESQDFHLGNFMARLTPHGPQLVITDPLYPDESTQDHWWTGM